MNNLSTLKGYMARSQNRTRLYVVTDEFALACMAYNPREEENSLFLDIGPYAVCSFETGNLVDRSIDFKNLHLREGDKFTRRFETHLRHLRGKRVTEKYLAAAQQIDSTAEKI